jgi:hypothetical protein
MPTGEVRIGRGGRVEARDGEAGRVHGLVVDDQHNTTSPVLLSEGHLREKKTAVVELKDLHDLEVT